MLLTSSFSDSHSRTASGFLESSQSSGSFAFPSESAQSTCRDSLNNPDKEKKVLFCVVCCDLGVLFRKSTALAKYFSKQTTNQQTKIQKKIKSLTYFSIFMQVKKSSYICKHLILRDTKC